MLADVDLLAPVPDRDPVAPPQLARDAPGPDLAHPVEVDALPLRRGDRDLVVLHDLDRRRRELVHAAEPLERDQRLDALARSVGERDRVDIRLLGAEHAFFAQGLGHGYLRLGHSHALEALAGLGGHQAVLADHADFLQPVLSADLEVVDVVARGDLESAGAEFGVDVLVGDDRQPPADQGQDAVATDQVGVSLVLRVHRDGGVGHHRLRADSGHGQHAVGVLYRVVDRVQGVGLLAVFDLEVGDRRTRARVPVDHVVVSVDVALLVELGEDLAHGEGVAVIEGEALALVVAGGPQALVLVLDPRRVLLLPLPDPLGEGLAPDIVPVDTLLAKALLDHRLGGDAGVVGTEDPERVLAGHAVHADQHVLHGAVQRVPHVERAGHVRGRDRDREVLVRGAGGFRVEVAAREPLGEDARLGLPRLPPGGLFESLSRRVVQGARSYWQGALRRCARRTGRARRYQGPPHGSRRSRGSAAGLSRSTRA